MATAAPADVTTAAPATTNTTLAASNGTDAETSASSRKGASWFLLAMLAYILSAVATNVTDATTAAPVTSNTTAAPAVATTAAPATTNTTAAPANGTDAETSASCRMCTTRVGGLAALAAMLGLARK